MRHVLVQEKVLLGSKNEKHKRTISGFMQRNVFLYHVCKCYVDRYNGEKEGEIRINGELRLMQPVLPQCAIVFDVG